MHIPIENIYYLLCYAWNKLEEKDRVAVAIDDKTDLLDLFAKVLINASKMLLKRGIDRNYIEYTSELTGVKGKLDISNTLKRNLLQQQRTICTFDTLSSNILSNQILVTTMYRLIRIFGLDKILRGELRHLLDMFYDIEIIELSHRLFKQVKLTRNNRFYGFLMNVCELIFESTLPSEEQGRFIFADFTRDERKMNQLFESFVRNFYRVEEKEEFSVDREIIRWQFISPDVTSYQYLPQMETDITLKNKARKIIIDTKYYSETMTLNYNKEKVHSTNIYQLFSYLINQESNDCRTIKATGILLYPTIDKDYDLNYKYGNHDILIKTVNLNTNWKNISARLKDIVHFAD